MAFSLSNTQLRLKNLYCYLLIYYVTEYAFENLSAVLFNNENNLLQVANETEVKAKIILQFSDVKGQLVNAHRNLVGTQKVRTVVGGE